MQIVHNTYITSFEKTLSTNLLREINTNRLFDANRLITLLRKEREESFYF